ncbi:MAG: glycoside hydrolase [Friedmanniella sp.]|nr:glycoside hydrolase [Friedmanniella sp.]
MSASSRTTRRGWLARIGAVVGVLALLVGAGYLRGSTSYIGGFPVPTIFPTPTTSPAASGDSEPEPVTPWPMPEQPPSGWTRLYGEDFSTSVPLGGFTNASNTDWYLADSNPYARTLRSYPDGWGTTHNRSLNFASKTADVVRDEFGARGVFRLHGYTPTTAGTDSALGGSFFPVLHPGAKTNAEQMGQTYGRYTVRFRTIGGYRPDVNGAYPSDSKLGRFGTAFLLWPVNDQWAEGEVDYPEMPWGAKIAGYVHQIGNPRVNGDSFKAPVTTDRGWQTATIEWYPGVLAFYLDGQLIRRVTENVPDTAMRWGFQSGGAVAVPPPDAEGYLLVDWITVDAYDGATPPSQQ